MKNLFSWKFLGLLALGAAGLATPASAQTTPVAFTPGNYVVLRVGDGAAALSSAATATFLLEYSPAGTLVQTIALPATGSSTVTAFTETGSATGEGYLTRSGDGRYLVIPGYNADAGTASLATSTSLAVNRLVARVSAAAAINTTTRISDNFSGSGIRSAASQDGSTFYAVGSGSGLVQVPFGTAATGTTFVVSSGTPTANRTINIFGGSLYISSASAGTYGLLKPSVPFPTPTGGSTLALLTGFSTASGPSPYSFFFTDQSTTVAGVDVVYVADERTTTDGGIQKWSLVNNSWTLNGTIAGGGATVRGLTGSVLSAANPVPQPVTLVATTPTGLYVLTDNAGYNVAPSTTALPATPTAANNVANTAFRGVAPAPLATALATRPEATQQELALYPSPAQDVLMLSLPTGPAAGHHAEVRDLLGRVVLTATLPASGQLSVAGLAPGTYLLTLDGALTRRFSKTD